MHSILFVLIAIAAAAVGGVMFILFMMDLELDAEPEVRDLVRSARRPPVQE